jgi:sterol desaturase/sphingolipid hydroxylase (fatty acid hydroxylase superfamily)
LPRRIEAVLSRVVVTPSIHWVHHHRVRRDTDSNYGTLFSFWDRLFASRSRTPRTPDMPIGVQGRDEASLPRLLALPFALAEPLSRRRSGSSSTAP